MVETDFHWGHNDLRLLLDHSNMTAMFTLGDETKVVQGRMETFPLGSLYDTDDSNDRPTHVIFMTPKMNNVGRAKV